MNQDQKMTVGQTVTDDHICQMAENAGFAELTADDSDLTCAVSQDASIKLQVIAFARALLALPH